MRDNTIGESPAEMSLHLFALITVVVAVFVSVTAFVGNSISAREQSAQHTQLEICI